MGEPEPEPEPAAGGWGWGSSFSGLTSALGDVAEGAVLLGSVMGVGAQVVGEVAATAMAAPDEPTSFRDTMKEAQRVQENKELAADFTAKQEVEAAEHAKAQAEAGALAASELEKVLQAEADTDGDGDGWGWGADASPTKTADGEDASAAEANAEASMEQAIDSGMATFSAGFATGIGVFSEVASAVGKNTVVGQMVLNGASKAIGQGAGGMAEVGEGAFVLMGALLAESNTVDLPAEAGGGGEGGEHVDVDMDAMAAMRKTNQELHRAISEDMKTYLTEHRDGTIQQWAYTSEWTKDTGGERDASGAPVRVCTGIFLELFTSMQQQVAAAGESDAADGWAELGTKKSPRAKTAVKTAKLGGKKLGGKKLASPKPESEPAAALVPEPEPEPEQQPDEADGWGDEDDGWPVEDAAEVQAVGADEPNAAAAPAEEEAEVARQERLGQLEPEPEPEPAPAPASADDFADAPDIPDDFDDAPDFDDDDF